MLKLGFYKNMRCVLLSLCLAITTTALSANGFSNIEKEAKGQTVYFNAWGGDAKINTYIKWASNVIHDRYGITLIHVKLTDTGSAISRILAEKAAGRTQDGSIDILWVNGENFASMKRAGLLQEQPWVSSLPNWQYTDSTELPSILTDFAEPTDGKESPWGRAQLVFTHDSARLKNPPKSATQLSDFIANNPGRFTFPQPPDFIGMSFLKQILIEVSDAHPALYQPVNEVSFDIVTAPLWQWLNSVNKNLWRGGKAYPANYPVLRQLLGDGEIDIAISFNPADASAAIARGELPNSVRTYIHENGTLANVHFLAIPFNASAPAAAKVVANFMLSPEAQVKKADTKIWGDPTVLSMQKLSPLQRNAFTKLQRGIATLSDADLVRTIDEPHPSWVPTLKAAWVKRYASGD